MLPRRTSERFRGIDWPLQNGVGIPEHQKHLILWQRHREFPYSSANLLDPVSEHFLIACRILFDTRQLVIHPWFETMAYAYTKFRKNIFMGAASSGKSHFIGLALLLDYITDPQNTYCCLVSDTKDNLKLRSLASAVEYLGYLKNHAKFYCPFKYVDQKSSIVPENTDDFSIDSQKSKIRGVAIKEGSSQDAQVSLAGVHLPRVRSVADEFENMGTRAQSFLKAQSNLGVANDYRQIVLFNPASIYAPGCLLATPADGWNSVNLDSVSWESGSGGYHVERFDGHKSPGIKEPDKYPFLPSAASMEQIKVENHGNEDSPGYWTMVRAFPPPHAEERTVLTESQIKSYNMLEPAKFHMDYVKMAALDPAFTAGGDDCVLVTAKAGMSIDKVFVLSYDKVFYLKILASDKRPVTQQIVDQVKQILNDEEIKIEHFGCDDSGTQSVADAVAVVLGTGLYRSNFSARPPELPVSVANAALASTKYRTTRAWLYYAIQEFGTFLQIKGLPMKAAEEFCRVRLSSKVQPHMLEPKTETKKRLGRSPDTADACAILAGMFRQVIGILPGQTEYDPAGFVPVGTYSNDDFIRKVNNIVSSYQ